MLQFQIKLLIVLFTIAFGIPLVRCMYHMYKQRLEKIIFNIIDHYKKRLKESVTATVQPATKKKGGAKAAQQTKVASP